MIFAHTLQQVLCGQKQQTRRIIKSDEKFENNRYIIKSEKRVLYEIGKTYAVQPNRGKKSVARIRMTGIRKEAVADITTADAQAEGFSSREDFLNTWRAIHGQHADLNSAVWVFEFELCDIIEEEIKAFYGNQNIQDQSLDYRENLPSPVSEVSRGGLHSGDYRIGGVGALISYRLPVSESGHPIQEISMD